MSSEQLDTIIRFHDPARLPELERCVFSLVGQHYRPLHIIVVLQRFDPAAIERVRLRLNLVLTQAQGVSLTIKNWNREQPADARTHLLNCGLEAVQGRYLGFLDYDDALYPEAYTLLVAHMQKSSAAITFASVQLFRFSVYQAFLYTREAINPPPFSGSNLRDLFVANFCPLHSYLIDRSQVNPADLYFDHRLVVAEDYDLLLRLCARYPSDFDLLGTQIGYYAFKDDNSNTLAIDGQLAGVISVESARTQDLLEQRRTSLKVSKEICRRLAPDCGPHEVTIREFINRAHPLPPEPPLNYQSLLGDVKRRGGLGAVLKKCARVYQREKIGGLRVRVSRVMARHR